MEPQEIQLSANVELICPYCGIDADICKASVSSMRLGPKTKILYCSSRVYDNCPIFLAKLLRRR
ncbi:MAG: hypothetical protein HY756_11715 [Nitrospirae bacterium]|nr:hypothetical protein [Nitrospirota bacterium]